MMPLQCYPQVMIGAEESEAEREGLEASSPSPPPSGGGGGAPFGGEAAGGDPTRYLGTPLPAAEARMWAGMSVDRRAKAIQRMKVLSTWRPGGDGAAAAAAARDAGVGVTRFYEMAKAWRAERSLASLGTFGAAPRSRLGAYDAVLNREVVSVVGAVPEDERVPVTDLVSRLALASGLEAEELPSPSTLRRYVERELLRRRRKAAAGHDLRLDCCPCRLGPNAGEVHFLYCVLDEATHAVLGAALGLPDDSRAGYAAAARDALARLERDGLPGLPWSDVFGSAEIVVGYDAGAWSAIGAEARAANVGGNVTAATADDRFGRYLRPLTRLRIGRVTILPGPRALEEVSGVEGREEWLGAEVDAYNDAISADWSADAPVPIGVRRLLALLAEV